MANEWIDTTVGAQATLQRGVDITKAEQRVGNVPVISSGGVSSYHDTPAAKGPGVVLGRKGIVGSVYFVDSDYWPHDTTLWVKDFHGNDPRFVYYFFRWMAPRISTMDVGSANPTLNRNHVHPIEIRWPPLSEQRAIVHILGTLDDKIELNRRMNEALEAMARALFKSWFVDFDPVRAKAEGRVPGLPKPFVDLFPDSFVDSDLGEIPNGWEVTSVGAVADVIDCLHSKKPERLDVGMPLLQLANVRDDGLLDMKDTYFIDETDYRKWVSRMEASPGDCVITNVGRVGAVAQVPVGQRAALGRNMTGVRCKPEFPFPTVLIECLLSQAMKDEIVLNMDTGTILDALNVRNIPRLRFVRPRAEILEYFEHIARPLRAQMESRLAESHALAALRDTLLPKLISGELRVRDGVA